jgi:hypothetical protein
MISKTIRIAGMIFLATFAFSSGRQNRKADPSTLKGTRNDSTRGFGMTALYAAASGDICQCWFAAFAGGLGVNLSFVAAM